MSEWYVHHPQRLRPNRLPVGLDADTAVDVLLLSGDIITRRAGGFMWNDVGFTSIIMWRRAGE